MNGRITQDSFTESDSLDCSLHHFEQSLNDIDPRELSMDQIECISIIAVKLSVLGAVALAFWKKSNVH